MVLRSLTSPIVRVKVRMVSPPPLVVVLLDVVEAAISPSLPVSVSVLSHGGKGPLVNAYTCGIEWRRGCKVS